MIKQNSDYIFCRISGAAYLLPYGQCVADNRRALRINESGAVLWDLIGKGIERRDLFYRYCAYYSAKGKQREELQKDMEDFLAMLLSHEILLEEENISVLAGAVSHYYKMGGTNIRLKAPKEVFLREFAPYETEENKADITIDLRPGVLRMKEQGTLLLRSREMLILEKPKEYLIQFLRAEQIMEAALLKDGSYVAVYYLPPCTETFCEELFCALRLFYLYAAQKKKCFALHSASILYRGKALLFSGYSGAGKSTQAALWEKRFGTPVLNGDLNLLGFQEETPVVYGIPWCGTSGITCKETYPIGEIVFIRQAQQNRCIELSEEEKVLSVVQRMISPVWTAELLEQNLYFAERLAKRIPMCRLECTPQEAAVETLRKWADMF